MDGGTREAVSSSAQLEDWAAGVAADINEDNTEDPRRRTGEAVTSPARQRSGSAQPSATVKRSRPQQERESSPEEEDNEAKDGSRPRLPRPEKKEACPRCSSTDTKFCYYNNYNIKQPRFYCKTCQRYWTAGGTLRNIAPGSGRRKSKSKAVGREQRGGPLLADHLTAAAAAQSGMFGLSVNANYPALLAAATDPAGLLGNGGGGGGSAGYPQLLGGHGGLTGLKLAGVSQLQGSWGNGISAADIHGNAVLREHLQAQLGVGASLSAGVGQQGMTSLDARLLLNGQSHLHGDDLPRGSGSLGAANGQGPSGGQQHGPAQQADTSSPSGSPPPHHHQQQVSSPQQPNSQVSQQPSPPQAQHNGSASDDPDVEGIEVCVQGRRVRLKSELDHPIGAPGGGLGSSGLGGVGGVHGSSSLQNLQLASLNLPPSMASLAAVMGPGGAPNGLGGNLHPLLSQQDNSAAGLLDGAQASLSRHHLQLALQHHQAAMQQESLQQLNGLLPHGSMSAAAALNAQHTLLQGLGHQAGAAPGQSSSTAAAVAALDPYQRSALLQQAAGLGGVGSWLQGAGGGVSGMLPSAAITAAALESLQVQSLAASGASSLLQAPLQSAGVGGSGSGSGADWLSLAAAAAAKGQASIGVSHPSAAAAVAAAHAANLGNGGSAIAGAAQMLQAHAAAAAGNGCGAGVGSWPSSGAFSAVSAGAPSWSLWSSYNNPASNNYAGYALHAAAAAAAYSGGR